MNCCTFFGNRDVEDYIEPILETAIRAIIENKGVRRFYVGNNGKFDLMVARCLARVKLDYPCIDYAIVLAYLPKENLLENTLYPEGMELVPKKYAITKRNIWMIDNSEYIISYANHIGCARRFEEIARRKGKLIVSIV